MTSAQVPTFQKGSKPGYNILVVLLKMNKNGHLIYFELTAADNIVRLNQTIAMG
jgi:hypothetical protein